MPQPFFRVERLTKRFGGLTAVNSVSFELKREQIVGLIGRASCRERVLCVV